MEQGPGQVAANDAIAPGIMASAFWHDARLYIESAKILVDNEAASNWSQANLVVREEFKSH
jgi:hypothetical protein